MPDKKPTDSEIVKALEDWIKNYDGSCVNFKTLGNTLDLINRLQAENEGLKGHPKDGFFNLLGNCLVFSKTLKDYNDMRKGLKAEAYKEFVDLLKAKADELQQVLLDGKWAISQYDVDKLLKEKVGSDLF